MNILKRLITSTDTVLAKVKSIRHMHITESTSWNRPSGVDTVILLMGGAGGGGGVGNGVTGGGGGGSGEVVYYDSIPVYSDISIVIGTGGSAGISGAAAGNGEYTSIGVSGLTGSSYEIFANGGLGGSSWSTSIGGAGATASQPPNIRSHFPGVTGINGTGLTGGEGGPNLYMGVFSTGETVIPNTGVGGRGGYTGSGVTGSNGFVHLWWFE